MRFDRYKAIHAVPYFRNFCMVFGEIRFLYLYYGAHGFSAPDVWEDKSP